MEKPYRAGAKPAAVTAAVIFPHLQRILGNSSSPRRQHPKGFAFLFLSSTNAGDCSLWLTPPLTLPRRRSQWPLTPLTPHPVIPSTTRPNCL